MKVGQKSLIGCKTFPRRRISVTSPSETIPDVQEPFLFRTCIPPANMKDALRHTKKVCRKKKCKRGKMFFDKNKEKFTIKDRTFIPRHSCSTEGVSFYICVEMGFVFADVKCRLSD